MSTVDTIINDPNIKKEVATQSPPGKKLQPQRKSHSQSAISHHEQFRIKKTFWIQEILAIFRAGFGRTEFVRQFLHFFRFPIQFSDIETHFESKVYQRVRFFSKNFQETKF